MRHSLQRYLLLFHVDSRSLDHLLEPRVPGNTNDPGRLNPRRNPTPKMTDGNANGGNEESISVGIIGAQNIPPSMEETRIGQADIVVLAIEMMIPTVPATACLRVAHNRRPKNESERAPRKKRHGLRNRLNPPLRNCSPRLLLLLVPSTIRSL